MPFLTCAADCILVFFPFPRSPVREVTLSAGGDVLSQICDASGLKLQDLMLWGRVGHHKVAYLAQPQEALAVLTTARGKDDIAVLVHEYSGYAD